MTAQDTHRPIKFTRVNGSFITADVEVLTYECQQLAGDCLLLLYCGCPLWAQAV